MIRLLLTYFVLCSVVVAQERREYSVPDFLGGLNVVTDSIDLNPNEAITLENFTLDRFGALHKRYGIENWNDNLISADTLKDIHYLEKKDGSKFLYLATNEHVYELSDWEDTVAAWSGKEIDYTRGDILATTVSSQKYIYGDTTSWPLSVSAGDKIVLQGGGSTYTIDSVLADTLLKVTEDITVVGDTFASYRILKNIAGVPHLSSWNGNLYVADNESVSWWYDGSEPYLLSIVDSGTVTTATAVDTTLATYDTGTVTITLFNSQIKISGGDISDTAFTVGNIFHVLYVNSNAPQRTAGFNSRITGTTIAGTDTFFIVETMSWQFNHMVFGDLPSVYDYPDVFGSRWWITAKEARLTVDQSQVLEDSNKIWLSDYYQGFFIINGNNTTEASYIAGNTERTLGFEANGTFQTIRIQPNDGNDNYTYLDTIGGNEVAWLSPGSGTDVEMVCDSMVDYINDDGSVNALVTAFDSTTHYTIKSDTIGRAITLGLDSAQTIIAGGIDNDSLQVVFAEGDRYYIGWQFPSVDSSFWSQIPIFRRQYSREIRFSQIIFHRNRLYAIGETIARQTAIPDWWPQPRFAKDDIVNTGRVYFSDIAIPTYIPPDWNFDVGGASKDYSVFSDDATQGRFVLRDDLYIITKSNIYRFSGEPVDGPETKGLFLSQVIRGVGTNQPNGIITTKDNNAFIMNQEGIWLFDGRIIDKISYKIEPLIEKYRASKMIAGQFKDNLYFSYPDSNVTIVLHLPTKAFTLWTVGMETMNNQFVAIDSNYFLFSQSEDSAYILKYPRDFTNFQDIWEPTDTTFIISAYVSGSQTYNTLKDKVVEDIEITAFNDGVSVESGNRLILYKDFSATALWDNNGFAGGDRIHNFESIGDSTGSLIWGKAFQVAVYDSTEFDFFLSSYKIIWYPGEK